MELSGMVVLAAVACAAAGYLLGGIDFAIIVSRSVYKTDIRTLGSGNAGMTNILRNFGKKGAALTLAGDAGKGVAAVLLGHLLFHLMAGGASTLYGAYIAGIGAILGHMYPLYFGFKGGKGVSVSGGVILTLQPILAVVLVLLFLLIVKLSGMVSLGSVVVILLYPVGTLLEALIRPARPLVYTTVCAALIALLVVYMHRENISRILAGSEYRFGGQGRGAGHRAAPGEQKPPKESGDE